MICYGLSIDQVQQQIAANNSNGGGSFIEEGAQQINVQSLGLYNSVEDIENTVVKSSGSSSIRIKDIATVTRGRRFGWGRSGARRI